MMTPTSGRARGGARNVSPTLIDADYNRKGAVIATDPERRAAFYGPSNDPPPLALALALHRHLLSRSPNFSAEEFATRLAKKIQLLLGLPEEDLDNSLRSIGLDHGRLRCWVQVSRPVSLPAPDQRATVLEALKHFASDHGVPNATIQAFFSGPSQSPSGLLKILSAESAPDAPHNAFEPIERQFLTPLPLAHSRHDDIVSDLATTILTDLGKTRIILLCGPAFAGKRRIITNLLCPRLQKGGVLHLPDNSTIRVFARASCRPFEDLVLDIATFLDITARNDQPVVSQLDYLLAQIAARTEAQPGEGPARPPSLYILCDVPAAAQPTGLVRQEGLLRLITTLHTSGNRILLTSEQETLPGIDPDVIFPKRVGESVLPTLNARLMAVGHAALQFDLVSAEIRGQGNQVELDPSLNLLFATLIHMIETSRADQAAAEPFAPTFDLRAFLLSIKELLGAGQPEHWQASLKALVAQAIYDSLDEDLRWLLRHLVMSSDGCRISSLVEMKHGALPHGDAHGSAMACMSAKADRLRDILFGLCRVDRAVPSPDEDPPGEPLREDWLCEIIIPFRQVFDDMLLDRNNNRQTDYRNENCNLARIAFMRSNWGRLRSSPTGWSGRSDLARLVQVLLRGLVAIDVEALDRQLAMPRKPQTRVSLEISWANIFQDNATKREEIDYISYFQFLYFDVFRGDLDLDYRLSKQFNRDDLRFLIMKSFMNPGTAFANLNDKQPFVESPLTPGPAGARLPQGAAEQKALGRIRALLSDYESVVFLETAALSAARCEFGRTLEEISRMAPAVPNASQRLHRVYRAQLDYSLLTCGRQGISDERGTLGSILDFCENCIDVVRNDFDPFEVCDLPRDYDAFVRYHRGCAALMKLQARLGELHTLMGDMTQAEDAFSGALNINRLLEVATAEVMDAAGNWRAVGIKPPFEGQAARRFIRFAYERSAASDGLPINLLQAAEAMQEANLRRVIRHPSEQHTLILNATLLALVRRHWGRAQHFLLDSMSDTSLRIGTTNSSSRYIDVSSALACLKVVRQAPEQQDIRAEALLVAAKKMIERTLRIANPAASNYPLFWIDGLLAAADFILISRQLHESGSAGVSMPELEFPPGAHPTTVHALLDTAESVVERSGYTLRTKDIERLRRMH